LPVAFEYCPDFVLVVMKNHLNSDPENTASDFRHHLIHLVSSLAEGRLLLMQEESSSPRNAQCCLSMLRILLGEPPLHPLLNMSSSPDPSVIDSLNNLRSSLKCHWNCFKASDTLSILELKQDILNDRSSGEATPGLTHAHKTPHAYTVPAGTALASDAAMTHHQHPDYPDYHPERPERLVSILQKLEAFGLTTKCQQLLSRQATKNEVQACHGELHVKETEKSKNFSTFGYYTNEKTFESALLAAGCLLNVVDAVMLGDEL
jgi:hypothetical protein